MPGKSSDRPALSAPSERYLASLSSERKLSRHTVAAYRRELLLLTHFARSDCRAATAESLAAHDIRVLAASLHARGLGARSIARALSAWRSYFDWLARNDLIPANPAVDVRAPKAGKRLPKALSPELAARLVGTASATGPLAARDAAMFELFYSSGLRLSELVGLDVAYAKERGHESAGWIDFDAGDVTVTGKGNKRRVVPVGAAALAALRVWLPVRNGFAKLDPHPLFLSERGERLSGRSVQTRLKAHARRLGIPANVHPHVLRHSFASHVLQSSGDLRAVQEMLGHASIAATQVYTSLDFQRLAQVYEATHPRARKRG